MTADERKMLEAVAIGRWISDPSREAVQQSACAALAEIDALNEALGCERSRVANLVSRITGKPGDTTNEAVGEASREALALRSQVATLIAERDEALARAIPKAWVESDHLEIQATFRSRVERIAIGQHVEGACLSVRTNGISSDQTLDTLRDALDAAAKESP